MPGSRYATPPRSEIIDCEAKIIEAQKRLEQERWDAYKATHPSISHPYGTRYKARLEAKVKASATPVPAPAPVPRRRRKTQAVNTEVEAPQPEVSLPAAVAAAAAAAAASSSSSSDYPAPSTTPNPIASSSGALPFKRPRAATEDDEEAEARPTKKQKHRSEEGSSLNEARKRRRQEDESDGDDESAIADGVIDEGESSTRPVKRMRYTSPRSLTSERRLDDEEASEDEGGEPQRASSAPPFVFDPDRLPVGSDEESNLHVEVNYLEELRQELRQELALKFEQAELEVRPEGNHVETLVYRYSNTYWQVTWRKPDQLKTDTTKDTGPQFNVDASHSWTTSEFPDNENKIVFTVVIDSLTWTVTHWIPAEDEYDDVLDDLPEDISDTSIPPLREQLSDSDSEDQPPAHVRQAGYGSQVDTAGRPPYRGTFGSDSEDDN